MADSAQERTEPATPRRREEARNRGQVAKSNDLTAAVVLFGTMVALYVVHEQFITQMVQIVQFCLGDLSGASVDAGAMVPTMKAVFNKAAFLVLPVIAIVLVLALASAIGQVGLLFTFKPITPSLDKLNPLNGLKRIFSSRSVVTLVMGLAKMSLLGLVAYWTLASRIQGLAFATELPYLALVQISIDFIFTLALRLAAVLLLLALIDLAYQRWKMEKDLRMTKQEIREEMKRMDGDPQLKRRRREVQLQQAVQRISAAVPQSDVVVTNPTHFAVALQYDSRTMNAPKLTAKGADFLAQRMRELAIKHGVPIVEKPPLARALYARVEVGQEIPAQFYRAVAEVLAYVYELAGRGHRRRSMAAAAN